MHHIHHKTGAFELADESETVKFAGILSQTLQVPSVIYLSGDLGAGKTTLIRALLRALNYRGTVKSPTYTLVEPYQFQNFDFHHFDCYRLTEPVELEDIGLCDYLTEKSVCAFEWPEKGGAIVPPADLKLRLDMLAGKRLLTLEVCTPEYGKTLENAMDSGLTIIKKKRE